MNLRAGGVYDRGKFRNSPAGLESLLDAQSLW